MKLTVCSVYDSKVNAFSPPFCVKSRGEAIRSFTDAVRDTTLNFHRHPADYRLFILGTWDDQDGSFHQPGAPEPILSADEISS